MESKLTLVRLKNRFQNALNRGHRHRLWCKLRGCDAHLLALDDVLAGKLVTRRPAKLEQVPLRDIRGSASRAKDYSATFLPLKASDESRWVRIAQAVEGPGLPPIRLLRYRGVYFVEDGHHRVSVLRFLKTKTVNAQVVDLVEIAKQPVAAGFAGGKPHHSQAHFLLF